MNKNELRVGNLILFNNDNVIFEVEEILEFGLSVKNSTEATYIEFDQFSGIKLTEKELNKFEWQLIKKDTYYINSYFSLDKYCHLFYNNDYTGINIDFVHELQNLSFSLTKKELQIKND